MAFDSHGKVYDCSTCVQRLAAYCVGVNIRNVISDSPRSIAVRPRNRAWPRQQSIHEDIFPIWNSASDTNTCDWEAFPLVLPLNEGAGPAGPAGPDDKDLRLT